MFYHFWALIFTICISDLRIQPFRLFFGRCIGEGRRDLITRLSIKTRKFIGNTTMDPTLSLLMANLTGVRDGDLVLDPFAGTGSILLAAAQGRRRSVRLSAQSITSRLKDSGTYMNLILICLME